MDAVDDLATIASWVKESERLVVLTGAGISTESGIPDFRGPQGIWTKNPEAERRAYIDVYVSDRSARVERWKAMAERGASRYLPNPGHVALADLERKGKLHTLVTQNVDGLHLAAGLSPENLVEIHGNTREVVCLSCGERAPMERALARVKAGEEDPPCRTCGGILKSATISFGQQLVDEDRERSETAAATCDFFFAIGTTLTVYPVAWLPELALRAGARLVILNDAPTEYDHRADALLRGKIGELLPAIVELV